MKVPPLTPQQTIGPFFDHHLLGDELRTLDGPETEGEHIRLEGRVTDGVGEPVSDAVIEVWQADAAGRYRHPRDPRSGEGDARFIGWGRCATDGDGGYWFETAKPGAVPHDAGRMAPHVNVMLHARGLLRPLATRLYFADEPATADDPILSLARPQRRHSLIAQQVEGLALPTYRLDLVLQGDARHETVFFDFSESRWLG